MGVKRIFYSSQFLRQLRKISSEDKKLLNKFEKIFFNDCFDSRLKTHKLSERLEKYWACSISYKIKIIFEFDNDGNITFISIGSHDIYK